MARGVKRQLPPLNWLRAFEAAARHMNFTEAAGELDVTQAAVSQHIKQLEDWFGSPLFRRLPRSLKLTDAGTAYLPVVRSALDDLAAGTAELFGTGRKGPVAVRVTSSLTYIWLVPRLRLFVGQYPDISLRLMTTPEPVDFDHDGIDIEIRYGTGNWEGVTAERLFDEELFPVCSPALADGPAALAKPADLQAHTLIHVVGEPENWQMWLKAAGEEGLALGPGIQFDLHMMATHAAIAGVGVALGLSPMVDDALEDGRLVAPFSARLAARDAHYVVSPEGDHLRPEADTFKQWLMATSGSRKD